MVGMKEGEGNQTLHPEREPVLLWAPVGTHRVDAGFPLVQQIILIPGDLLVNKKKTKIKDNANKFECFVTFSAWDKSLLWHIKKLCSTLILKTAFFCPLK